MITEDNNINTMKSAVMNDKETKQNKPLTGDEIIARNRERNKLHARKTRQRKKTQTAVLQGRINELYEEGVKLRQIIDERYTASSLLGLSQAIGGNGTSSIKLLPSSVLCNDYYSKVLAENSWLSGENGPGKDEPSVVSKRVRRSGKYSPQERERIRRERNRKHAKKTRDRKRYFMEISSTLIYEMEREAKIMREYLCSIGAMSMADVIAAEQHDIQCRLDIANSKLHACEEDEDGLNTADIKDENNTSNPAKRQKVGDYDGDENEEIEKNSTASGSNECSSNHESGSYNSGRTSKEANTSNSGSVNTSSVSKLSTEPVDIDTVTNTMADAAAQSVVASLDCASTLSPNSSKKRKDSISNNVSSKRRSSRANSPLDSSKVSTQKGEESSGLNQDSLRSHNDSTNYFNSIHNAAIAQHSQPQDWLQFLAPYYPAPLGYNVDPASIANPVFPTTLPAGQPTFPTVDYSGMSKESQDNCNAYIASLASAAAQAAMNVDATGVTAWKSNTGIFHPHYYQMLLAYQAAFAAANAAAISHISPNMIANSINQVQTEKNNDNGKDKEGKARLSNPFGLSLIPSHDEVEASSISRSQNDNIGGGVTGRATDSCENQSVISSIHITSIGGDGGKEVPGGVVAATASHEAITVNDNGDNISMSSNSLSNSSRSHVDSRESTTSRESKNIDCPQSPRSIALFAAAAVARAAPFYAGRDSAESSRVTNSRTSVSSIDEVSGNSSQPTRDDAQSEQK